MAFCCSHTCKHAPRAIFACLRTPSRCCTVLRTVISEGRSGTMQNLYSALGAGTVAGVPAPTGMAGRCGNGGRSFEFPGSAVPAGAGCCRSAAGSMDLTYNPFSITLLPCSSSCRTVLYFVRVFLVCLPFWGLSLVLHNNSLHRLLSSIILTTGLGLFAAFLCLLYTATYTILCWYVRNCPAEDMSICDMGSS